MQAVDPPKADGNRALVSLRLAEVRKGSGARETVTIEWRGKPKSIDVIDMPVGALYYNPETHRVAAQRTLDPDRNAELSRSPWSDEGQLYLHTLLMGDPTDPTREDPEFQALKQDLRDHGQSEPGIITPTGILVNGNTRRAALKEVGEESIRVGVLPDDWSWADISAVELSLQLRKEFRREYSFINFLLAVEEQTNSRGRPQDEVAKDFRIKVSTLQRALWILDFIRDAIERSKVSLPGGKAASLRLIDFERHQGKLEELYRTYMSLDSRDPAAAAKLRENRLVAVALDYSKTDVRLVEPNFYERYLRGHLPLEALPTEDTDSEVVVGIPGLEVDLPPEPAQVGHASALADKVLRAVAIVRPDSGADERLISDAKQFVADVGRAVDRGLDAAGRDIRLRQRKQAAPDRLQTAIESVDLCTKDVVEARAAGGLDIEAMEEAILSLRDSLRELAGQLHRTVGEPGVGVAWLLDASSMGD